MKEPGNKSREMSFLSLGQEEKKSPEAQERQRCENPEELASLLLCHLPTCPETLGGIIFPFGNPGTGDSPTVLPQLVLQPPRAWEAVERPGLFSPCERLILWSLGRRHPPWRAGIRPAEKGIFCSVSKT
jgi:hypothetical protein